MSGNARVPVGRTAHARTAGLYRRHEALSTGISDDEIRRRCLGGSWRRVHRGAYAESAMMAGLDAVARHRLRVAALIPAMADEAVVSHQSAAVLLGAPMAPALLDRVHVTRNRRHGGRIKANVKVHCAPVDCVVELDGLLVTSPARTVVDLARTAAFEPAVVVADALGRQFGITAGELDAELELARRRRGIDAARRVVDFLDPRSGGVDQSRVRAALPRLGLPPAEAGGVVHTEDGQALGTVDLYLGQTGVVLIVDPPPGTRRDPVPTETVLRRHRFQPVRTTWRELSAGVSTARLRTALIASREQPPRGFIRPAPLPEHVSLPRRSL
ncbi:MAG: hypothetical protein J2P18_17605 [Nocardia sp.]|nr:hypothetical protein [Nocardia sp.]